MTAICIIIKIDLNNKSILLNSFNFLVKLFFLLRNIFRDFYLEVNYVIAFIWWVYDVKSLIWDPNFLSVLCSTWHSNFLFITINSININRCSENSINDRYISVTHSIVSLPFYRRVSGYLDINNEISVHIPFSSKLYTGVIIDTSRNINLLCDFCWWNSHSRTRRTLMLNLFSLA